MNWNERETCNIELTQFLKVFLQNHKINGTDPTKCLFHATVFHAAKAINKLKKCRNEFSFLSFSSWLTYIFREQNRINFREKIHGFVMILFGFELRTMVLRWQLVSPGFATRTVVTGDRGTYLVNPQPFNPIPTGHGRNQPIYERHVTKSGRNRVNLHPDFSRVPLRPDFFRVLSEIF